MWDTLGEDASFRGFSRGAWGTSKFNANWVLLSDKPDPKTYVRSQSSGIESPSILPDGSYKAGSFFDATTKCFYVFVQISFYSRVDQLHSSMLVIYQRQYKFKMMMVRFLAIIQMKCGDIIQLLECGLGLVEHLIQILMVLVVRKILPPLQ